MSTLNAMADSLPPLPARMAGHPFGADEAGRPIAHVKGPVVVGTVGYMLDCVAQRAAASLPPEIGAAEHGARIEQAREQALGQLVERLNASIPDPVYHLTADYLLDDHHSYSMEFLVFLDGITLQFQLKCVGTRGELLVNDIAGTAAWRPHPGQDYGPPEGWQSFSPAGPSNMSTAQPVFLAAQIADFIASIRENRRYVADGWAGLRHMEIDASITESIRTGKPVAVMKNGPADAAALLDEAGRVGRDPT